MNMQSVTLHAKLKHFLGVWYCSCEQQELHKKSSESWSYLEQRYLSLFVETPYHISIIYIIIKKINKFF